MLQSQFGKRALLVTEDSEEWARADAAEIGRSGKYDAVVSVAMLREGWDVPEVGVVLLLRKFGSRVYGPQVVGRGLRRVRRPNIDPAEPQICAVVDHPKLEHRWLWELLRAKVRGGVRVDAEFDEKQDLPEPPRRQVVKNPELLIAIPEPIDPDGEPLTVDVPPSPDPSRDWRNLLADLRYNVGSVEITGVKIDRVTGRPLVPGQFTSLESAPDSPDPTPIASLPRDQLAESIDRYIQYIAELALEAGRLLGAAGVAHPLTDHGSRLRTIR